MTKENLTILKHIATHYIFYGPDWEKMLFAINLTLNEKVYLNEFDLIMDLILENQQQNSELMIYYTNYFNNCINIVNDDNLMVSSWILDLDRESGFIDARDHQQIKLAFLAILKYFNIPIPKLAYALEVIILEYAFLTINYPKSATLICVTLRTLLLDYIKQDKIQQDKLTQVLNSNKFYQDCMYCYNNIYVFLYNTQKYTEDQIEKYMFNSAKNYICTYQN